MKCCADEAGAGRPHVDQPEAADRHHVATATVDAEDIRCCSASSNEKKKLTIKGCFLLCMFQQRLVLTVCSVFRKSVLEAPQISDRTDVLGSGFVSSWLNAHIVALDKSIS